MTASGAATVESYLSELPPERRAVVAAVRETIRRHLPAGYEEAMSFGMIGYGVPLSRYPRTYNGQPLAYVALAAQKSHYALYLMDAYQDPARADWLEAAFERAGKKLDMGKSCVRFRHLGDLPLDAIGEFIAGRPVDDFIAHYEAVRAGATGAKPASGENRATGATKEKVAKTAKGAKRTRG
ncbi:MAG TPA: DUF1801 domain-containing protein [Gemmatimonadaceae bacterium]